MPPNKRKPCCSKLKVGNDLVTNKEDLLHIWADHFTKLSKSKINDSEGLQRLNDKVQSLFNESLLNEEYLLDTPFTVEELEQAPLEAEEEKSIWPGWTLCRASEVWRASFTYMVVENPQ